MELTCLPPEIITSILLRLPIKTLVNARLVNKSWFQFISSSDFTTAHLKKSTGSFSCHRVLFNTNSSGHLLRQFSVESLLWDFSLLNLVRFGYPHEACSRKPSVWLVGSCNGLVCVASTGRRILVLNPCTGKYNELRPLDFKHRLSIDPDVTYGFGYDESNNDYKVVAVCLFQHDGFGDDRRCRSMVKVYSLMSNSWKRIDDFEGGILGSVVGKLVSGKVHWFTDHRYDEYCRRNIISFDVGSEVFGIIEQPSDHIEKTLDVLEGFLCLLFHYEQSHADLWVMKEYGVKESWTKVVTISYIDVIEELSPCSLLPNGEILFFTVESFAVYSPKDDSFRFLNIRRLDNGFEPVSYVQSLVSPVGARQGRMEKAKLV